MPLSDLHLVSFDPSFDPGSQLLRSCRGSEADLTPDCFEPPALPGFWFVIEALLLLNYFILRDNEVKTSTKFPTDSLSRKEADMPVSLFEIASLVRLVERLVLQPCIFDATK